MTLRTLFGLLVCGLIFVGCGTTSKMKANGGLFSMKTEGGLLNDTPRSPASLLETKEVQLEGALFGAQLKNTTFDLPVVYNEEVRDWIEYFTGAGRRHFQIYLQRKAKMDPIILPRLQEAKLPQDLIYLAMIESGFSTAAHSHAGAMGPWQFIKSTGRIFGLESSWWMDERRDPVKSTEAAIAYLTRLHDEFGDWALACAAYNSGEMRIRNAISKLGTRDFWTIARNRKALRRETKDYVPKMMAAAIIGKNAEQFGFEIYPADSSLLEFEEVRIPRAENMRTIARVADVSRERLAELNPELMRCCTPPQRGAYTIRVPKGDASKNLLAAVDAGEIGRFADFRRHVVRRGDTLSRIASSHGVPIEAILSMNEIPRVKALKPGTELMVPDRGRLTPPARAVASMGSAPRAEPGRTSVTHVVKRGDTLYGISRRYAVRVEEIRRWNSIQRSKNLRPGSRIKLYVRNDRNDTI